MEFSELSHAGQCLDIYLHNTESVYTAYTVPAIKRLAEMQRGDNFTMWHVMQDAITDWDAVDNAIQAAARLVRKYDGMQPTLQDIEAVTANYVAYIIDCAKYELQNA